MTKLEELTNILCECESVKRDVMELREGCKIGVYVFATDSYVYGTMTGPIKFNIDSDVYEVKDYPLHKNLQKREYENMEGYDKGYINIIGNPIQDHHLRMYCKDKITDHKQICFGREDISFYKTGIKFATLKRYLFIDNYDITKPLSEQSDETLTKIINFLKDKLGKN